MIKDAKNDKRCKKNYRQKEQWENMCRYLLSKYMIAFTWADYKDTLLY